MIFCEIIPSRFNSLGSSLHDVTAFDGRGQNLSGKKRDDGERGQNCSKLRDLFYGLPYHLHGFCSLKMYKLFVQSGCTRL